MTESMVQSSERKTRRTRIGVVRSAHKTPQTICVDVEYQVRHPKYGKILRRTTRLHVHDPKNEANPGDKVEVMACRPVSKTKTWRLVRVMTAAPQD